MYATGMDNSLDTPATPEDLQRVIGAASVRAGYLLWLANYLERSDDIYLRKAAAAELRQLAGR